VRDNLTEYWNIDSNNINLTWNSTARNIAIHANGESLGMSQNLSAPQDFSYHCSNYTIRYRLNETTNGKKQIISFHNANNHDFMIAKKKRKRFTTQIWLKTVNIL
jgi:hypothetical protein